ncbi:MAG: polysaccharide deacetylase family protein [Candidatus Bathyarchaeota archaeon]|nr:polysaccharide deacetylase family protein [Candidatus Bathyarchaeota archaeon]
MKLATWRNLIRHDEIDCALAGLEETVSVMNKLACPATYFLEGVFCKILSKKVKNLLCHDSEIGSHGFSHESYTRFWPKGNWFSKSEVERSLRKSILLIKQFSGEDVRSFRAPFLALEGRWLTIMHKYGITADSSLYNIAYGFSSTPYHSSFDDLSRLGAAPVWQVPITVYPMPRKSPLSSPYLPILGIEENRFRTFLNELRGSSSKEMVRIIVTIFHPWELFEGSNRAKSRARIKLNRLVELIELTRECGGDILTVHNLIKRLEAEPSKM